MCDQNQVTASPDSSMQPMSPMSPMSPMDHQSSQQPMATQQQQQHTSNQINDMHNSMVVEQLDVSMLHQQQHQQQQQQQQQTMVDSMNQYQRTNGTNPNDIYRNNPMSNSNSSYSMQSHLSSDPICGAANASVNGHDTMQMNNFGNGLIRKMKNNGEDANMQVHPQSPFLLSAGPSDSGILNVNGYGMNLKQEPDVTF